MLQGARREPDAESTSLSTGFVVLPVSFFARAFSTYSCSNALVGMRLRQQTRFTVPEEGDSSAAATPFTYVASRYRVLSRVESRGKTSYVGTERPSMLNSVLDVRTLRTKSPRSRQYLVRTPATGVLAQVDVLSTYRDATSQLIQNTESQRLTRSVRRFCRPTSASYASSVSPVLLETRKSFQVRDSAGLLTAEQAMRSCKASLSEYLCFPGRRVVHPRG